MYKGYIYRHWIINDKEQEKSYIGQVYNKKPQKRWGINGKGYLRKRGGKEEDHKFARAIRKYGWDNFNHKILLTIECETPEELIFWLDEWEKYYIEKYDSFHNGYNSTTGGSSGIRCEETRRKIGEAQKGIPRSDETKKKISETKKGYKHKKEIIQKISEQRRGKCIGENNPMYGKKGELSPFYGKHHTEEWKQKRSEEMNGENNPRARKVICIETLQVFNTIKEAQKWCNIKSGVGGCCKGQGKYAGKHPITGIKLHWMYYSDYLKLQEEQQNKEQDLVTEVA